MDNQCYQCAEKFGFFRKEYGCKKCGHSFCKTCLPYSCAIPGKGPKLQPVCKSCYSAINASPEERKQNEQNEGKYSPPENHKKYVAAYEAKKQAAGGRSQQPSTSSTSGAATENKYKGLSEADRKLSERLDRLKEDRKKMRGRVASVEEMEDRLRNLKGLPPSGSSDASSSQNQAASNLPPADTRTSYQQSDDLMTQMKEEAALDARITGQEHMEEDDSKDIEIPSEPELKGLEDEAKKLIQDAKGSLHREEEGAKRDEELAAWVNKLKGINPASNSDREADAEKEVSDEEATKRLIAQLLAEDKMEAKIRADGFGDVLSQQRHVPSSEHSGVATNKPAVDPDELPWCCICNEDATLRCRGCDDDLYCARCFREGHDQFDLPDHKTVRYKKPRNDGR